MSERKGRREPYRRLLGFAAPEGALQPPELAEEGG